MKWLSATTNGRRNGEEFLGSFLGLLGIAGSTEEGCRRKRKRKCWQVLSGHQKKRVILELIEKAKAAFSDFNECKGSTVSSVTFHNLVTGKEETISLSAQPAAPPLVEG